jgi:hypothetical protein
MFYINKFHFFQISSHASWVYCSLIIKLQNFKPFYNRCSWSLVSECGNCYWSTSRNSIFFGWHAPPPHFSTGLHFRRSCGSYSSTVKNLMRRNTNFTKKSVLPDLYQNCRNFTKSKKYTEYGHTVYDIFCEMPTLFFYNLYARYGLLSVFPLWKNKFPSQHFEIPFLD